MKVCTKCKVPKPKEDFGKNNGRKDNLQCWCKGCINRKICLKLRTTHREIKAKIYNKLDYRCSRCGFSDERALQIDHVNGGGYREDGGHGSRGVSFLRKVLADTSGMYQILCANCNWIKRSENKEGKPTIYN